LSSKPFRAQSPSSNQRRAAAFGRSSRLSLARAKGGPHCARGFRGDAGVGQVFGGRSLAASLGWGLASAEGRTLITLYPVGSCGRTTILRAGGREARDGPDQSSPRVQPKGRGRSRVPSRTRRTARRLARFGLSAQARLSTAPSGTRPVSRQRQSATESLRAMATIAMRLTRPLRSPTRSSNPFERALSG